MDRPGVRQVPEGSGEQGKKEKTGCKIICGAPTTLAVKGLTMMMMMMTQDRSTVAGDAVWTVATLDDRCHQSSNVLWTIMTWWVLFSALQGGESGGTCDQERNTQLSWICCILCRIQTGFTSFEVPYSNANHSHLPPLFQLKASFLSWGLAPTPVPLKKSQPPKNSSSRINITTLDEYSTTY